jgi:hypothetical protein
MSRRRRHKKRGTEYVEIGRAVLQNSHDMHLHDDDILVVYQGDEGRLFARPADEFEDGRFELVG